MNAAGDCLQSHLGEVKQLGGKAKSSLECGRSTASVKKPQVQRSARGSADVENSNVCQVDNDQNSNCKFNLL